MLTKKIAFVGPYGSANFGDWAMLVNNIYDLDCQDAIVFTYNTRFPEVSLDEYLYNRTFKCIEVKLKENKLKYLNDRPENINFATPFDILSKIDNYEEIYNYLLEVDTLVVSGGGWINHFWAERGDKLFKIIAPILIASEMSKEIVFTANGIGPLDNSEEIYRFFFRHIEKATIGIRDKYCSQSYLLNIGVNKNNIHYIPDDLYIINQSLIEKQNHKNLATEDYIVIEMYSSLDELKEHENQLIKFSNNIYEKYGLSIIFLPYDLVHFGSDQAKYLNSICKNSKVYDIDETSYLPIQDAYRIIKNAKFMITSRYHGLVLSLSAKTPVKFKLVDIKGDMRYSYNKGYGMLKSAFEGLEFRDSYFLSGSLAEVLNDVEENYNEISNVQKDLYRTKEYEDNKLKLKNARLNYLNNIIR